MARIVDYIVYLLARLLYRVRGHDAKFLLKSPAFKAITGQNMTLEAPECGPSGSSLPLQYSAAAKDGNGIFPDLRWTPPSTGAGQVKEQVLLCEDPDPPIPGLLIDHGIFYAIPPDVHNARNDDITPKESSDATDAGTEHVTQAGWKYIPTMRGTSWIPAGAPLGHGPHRYVFTVIALNEKLDFDGPEVNKEKLKEAIHGKVLGWGQWIGIFERPWPE